ncbi:MAG: hypothetical protein EB084_20075 [Proteobacteria bacterium]|nr:hypothetical protein [Pseudomonadota bacterium]
MNQPSEEAREARSHTVARAPLAGLPAQEVALDDWAAMGKAFEGMCKAGLALTVGFSVAAAFCKMMDAKNVNIPNLVNKFAGSVMQGEASPEKRD